VGAGERAGRTREGHHFFQRTLKHPGQFKTHVEERQKQDRLVALADEQAAKGKAVHAAGLSVAEQIEGFGMPGNIACQRSGGTASIRSRNSSFSGCIEES